MADNRSARAARFLHQRRRARHAGGGLNRIEAVRRGEFRMASAQRLQGAEAPGAHCYQLEPFNVGVVTNRTEGVAL